MNTARRERTGLRQLLGRKHAERDADHDAVAALRGPLAARDDLAEAELLRERHAGVQRREGAAVVEVGGVDDVAGGAEVVGEGEDALGQPLGVVEQQNLSH